LSDAAEGGVDFGALGPGTEPAEGGFDLGVGAFDSVEAGFGAFSLAEEGFEEPGVFAAPPRGPCSLPLFSLPAEAAFLPCPVGVATAPSAGASLTPEVDRDTGPESAPWSPAEPEPLPDPAEAPEPLPAPVESTGAAEPAFDGGAVEPRLGEAAVGAPVDTSPDPFPIALPPPRPA
jgi:hypothetical protein